MAPTPPLANRIGTVVRDKWVLDSLLGSGGMAAVYAATHRNGMRAAIKMLHLHLAENEETRTRFAREGCVANRVAHPGAVRVLDDDIGDDGAPFMVMELLEGETLANRIRSGRRLPLSFVVDVAIDVLDVLAAAHAAGVVHRDVKPANVFLTSDGRIKLLDFGIARLRECASRVELTTSASTLGTPAFMPPEQALAQWDCVDHRSDLFGVGATIWTLVSGRTVHRADSLTELLILASSRPARPIEELVPDIPRALAAVIDRALAFERSNRWEDARAMQRALRAAYDRMTDTNALAEPPARASGATASFAVHRTHLLEAPDPPSPALVTTAANTPPVPLAVARGALLASASADWTFGQSAATPPPGDPRGSRRVLGAAAVLAMAGAIGSLFVHVVRLHQREAAATPASAAASIAQPAVAAAGSAPIPPGAPSFDATVSAAISASDGAYLAPVPALSSSAPQQRWRPRAAPKTAATAAASPTSSDTLDPLERFDR